MFAAVKFSYGVIKWLVSGYRNCNWININVFSIRKLSNCRVALSNRKKHTVYVLATLLCMLPKIVRMIDTNVPLFFSDMHLD